MVKRQHKFISLVLCVMLVCSVLFTCAVSSASAASGDVVYVKINKSWNPVYCYAWTDGGASNGSWPGSQMTCVDSVNKIYSYTMNGNYAKVIFNNGQSGGGDDKQTTDLTFPGNGQLYDMATQTWSAYSSGSGDSTNPATQPATQPATNPSGSGKTVYLNNTAGWTNPYCYTWTNGSSDQNSNFPGKAMTSVGEGVWMYSGSDNFANCIFSNNSADQTANLTATDGYIYDNTTKQWSVYDTSPIRVTSFSADPSSEVYAGMDVALSAQATSTGGTVTYKFSVAPASGTATAITGWISSGTATWTPSATGAYTITVDFADTSGNTNSRTISLNVLSDSGVAKPIIKKVSPANGSYIQTGRNQTVSVTAAGGNTGTNLLFYKYVVTDPSGNKNTPYYTLNSTYTFQANRQGTYTVDVFVQASDNTTVSKSYTYTSAGTVPSTTAEPTVTAPPATTVQPTTVQPTTVQPTTVQPTTVQPTNVDPVTYEKGDVDRNGVINIKDATYLQKCVAEYSEFQDVTLELGDIYVDNIISVRDATELQRIIAYRDAA